MMGIFACILMGYWQGLAVVLPVQLALVAVSCLTLPVFLPDEKLKGRKLLLILIAILEIVMLGFYLLSMFGFRI